MFKLQPDPTFKAKVSLSAAGRAKPVDVEFEFRYFDQEEWVAFLTGNEKTVADVLADDIITGWNGVDAPFNAENLKTLFKRRPLSAGEVWKAFLSELFEAKAKN